MSKRGNEDYEDDDDFHIDPGDDGLVNTGADMPPFLNRIDPEDDDDWDTNSNNDDDWDGDEYREYFDLAEQYNFDLEFAASRLHFDDSGVGVGSEDFRARGTVFMTPQDALQAILDAHIFGISIVFATTEGWKIGVRSNTD